MDKIEEILWNLTVDKVTRLCKIANIKGRTGIKEQKIKLLLKFFSNENWVKETFKELTNYEKDMMKCIIQNKYHPENSEIQKILDKHKSKKYYYSDSYFKENSKVNLFYLYGRRIPEEFKEKLNEIIEPLEINIEPTEKEIDPEGFFANIVGRDKRTSDFDEIIKFVNTNKIKATKAKQQMPKASLLKIHRKLRYRDVLKNDEIDFESIRNIEDTTVSNGLINLLRNSLILRIKKEQFVVDDLFCKEYQQLNKVEKIKFLLKEYLSSDSIYINECDRIESANFYIDNRLPKFGSARRLIIEYLKKAPIDKWVEVSELEKMIRINEYEFLRPYTGEVLIKDEYYNQYYQEATHNEFEKAFINVVLMEYLAVMGIIDVVITQYEDDYGWREYLEVEYFKITKFGSYVLDMAKQEENEEENDEGFVVTKDFQIKIKDNNQKLKFELFFDRFLDKKSESPLIYNLNFKGMAKALELGIKFKEIYEYLQENSEEDIPLNVKAQFEDWIKMSTKIKIKNVTILEVDNENFDDIIRSKDYKECIDSIRSNIIILKPSKIEKIKEKLNENGKFCI